MAGPEKRGITLGQLKKLRSFLQQHADADGVLPWYDRSLAGFTPQLLSTDPVRFS